MTRWTLRIVTVCLLAWLVHATVNGWVIFPLPALTLPDPVDRTPDPNTEYALN